MFSLRKYLILVLLGGAFFCSYTAAQDLEIIPQVDGSKTPSVAQDVESVSVGGDVWKNYNTVLKSKRPLEEQLASGIMGWDTVLTYFAHFVKYLSQLGIFIGSCFVIYAGYVYATAVFQDGKVSNANTAIKNAILGVIVITFSYAIMKAVMAAFL